MKNFFLVAVGVVAITACQKKSDDVKPVTFDERVPQKLSFIEPVKGPKPSQAQIDEVKSTFENKSKMMLPPGELVFPPEDVSIAELKKQEETLKKADSNSHKMLKEIHQSCSMSNPAPQSTFPKESSTHAFKAGEVYSYTQKLALTARTAECPATLETNVDTKLVVESLDEAKKQFGFSSNGDGKLKLMILKPEYQKLLNARGMIIDTNITFMTSLIDVSGKVYVSAGFAGSYLTLDKQVDYTSTFEMVSKSDQKKSRSEVIMKAVLKYPNFQIDVVTYQVQEDEKIVEHRVYLNGNKLTDAEEKNIFKNETPGFGVLKHNQVLKVLR